MSSAMLNAMQMPVYGVEWAGRTSCADELLAFCAEPGINNQQTCKKTRFYIVQTQDKQAQAILCSDIGRNHFAVS